MSVRPAEIVVISDCHLGTYASRARELCGYLQTISPRLLILNGDIIDGWQFSKKYFPSAHVMVLQEIFRLLAAGTEVYYISGNHDEMLRRYTDLHLGKLHCTDKLLLEMNGQKTWIFHGDVFDYSVSGSARFLAKLGSNGYAVLMGFNRLMNRIRALFRLKPLSFSRKLIHRINKSIVRLDKLEQTIGEIALEKNYDYVICGHTHMPVRREYRNEERSVVYINSGDWLEHCTAAEYYDGSWHLYYYKHTAVTLPAKTPVQKPDFYSLQTVLSI